MHSTKQKRFAAVSKRSQSSTNSKHRRQLATKPSPPLLQRASTNLQIPRFSQPKPSSLRQRSLNLAAQRNYTNFGGSGTPEASAKSFYATLQASHPYLQSDFQTPPSNPDSISHTQDPGEHDQGQQRTQLTSPYHSVHDQQSTADASKRGKYSHYVPPSQDAGYITMSPRVEAEPGTFARRMMTYWFQDYQRGQIVSDACRRKWFIGHPILDKYLVYEFGADFEAYKQEKMSSTPGPYSEIERHPLGALSLIILVTQYPKAHLRLAKAANGGILTPELVATSHYGPTSKFLSETFQEMIYNSIQSLHPLRFDVVERVFFFLPFLAIENRISQKIATARLSDLVDEAPRIHKPFLTAMKEFSLAHLDVIQQFGRFPQRNKLMARESTEEEREYLRLHASSWDPVDVFQIVQDDFHNKPSSSLQQDSGSLQYPPELAAKPRNPGAWRM